MGSYLRKVFYILGSEKKKLPMIIFLFILLSFLDLLGLNLIAPYFGMIINPDGFSENSGILSFFKNFGIFNEIDLNYLGIIILFIFLIKTLSSIFINYIIIKFSMYQQVRLATHLMRSYQKMNYETYINRKSSEYIYNIQSLSNIFATNIVLPGLRLTGDFFICVIIFLYLSFVNIFAFTLILIILSFAVLLYNLIVKDKVVSYGQKVNESSTELVQHIQEAMYGFKELRIFKKEYLWFDKVYSSVKKYASNFAKSSLTSIIPRYFLEFLMILFLVTLIFSSKFNLIKIQDLIPTLAIFGIAAMRLLPIFNTFSNHLIQILYSKNALDRIYCDLSSFDSKFKINDVKLNLEQRLKWKKLKIIDVSFKYNLSKKNVLNKVSIEIEKGMIIGIVGSSGSGKTTLINLILGLLNPQNGMLSLDGKIGSKVMDLWHYNVAYLPQQTFLISDSIKSNITLGLSESQIDYKLLNESIKKAKLSKFIQGLELGENTKIGERGFKLSGGQSQRIALARAFYHKKDIIVMDEATSALNMELEDEIIKEIETFRGEKTIIIITHRLNSLSNCDVVYKIVDGSIIKGKTTKND